MRPPTAAGRASGPAAAARPGRWRTLAGLALFIINIIGVNAVLKRNFIWQRLAGLAADGLEDGVALRRCGGADGCAGAGGAGAADGDVLEEAMERRLVRLCARWLFVGAVAGCCALEARV